MSALCLLTLSLSCLLASALGASASNRSLGASALNRSLTASTTVAPEEDEWDCSQSVWTARWSQDGETCPPTSKIPACNCRQRGDYGDSPDLPTGLRVVCVGTEMTLDDFRNLRGKWISSMEIASCTDTSLTSGRFVGLNVFQLKLDGTCSHIVSHRRDSKSSGPFRGLENSLQELLLHNRIAGQYTRITLTSVKLYHLKNLRKLSFFHWYIRDIPKGFFQIRPPGCLQHLSVRWSRLQRIHEGAFANLTNLERLQLDDNKMTAFNRSALDDVAEKLVELSLENNDLQSLPENMFSGMPSLKTVHLNRNFLRSLPEVTWSPVWNQLQSLDLSQNSLECDSNFEWMLRKKYPERFVAACSTDVKKFNHAKNYTLKVPAEETGPRRVDTGPGVKERKLGSPSSSAQELNHI